MRFKPPPPGSPIGWRVEFRPMEVQLTDFENAAFAVFIVLLTRAIISSSASLLDRARTDSRPQLLPADLEGRREHAPRAQAERRARGQVLLPQARLRPAVASGVVERVVSVWWRIARAFAQRIAERIAAAGLAVAVSERVAGAARARRGDRGRVRRVHRRRDPQRPRVRSLPRPDRCRPPLRRLAQHRRSDAHRPRSLSFLRPRSRQRCVDTRSCS